MKKQKTYPWDRITASAFEQYLADRITINGRPLQKKEVQSIIDYIFSAITDILMSKGQLRLRDFGNVALYNINDRLRRHRIVISLDKRVEDAIRGNERLLNVSDNIVEECRKNKFDIEMRKAQYDAKMKEIWAEIAERKKKASAS